MGVKLVWPRESNNLLNQNNNQIFFLLKLGMGNYHEQMKQKYYDKASTNISILENIIE